MSIHNHAPVVRAAAAHLLSSAYYTKDAGDPLDVLAKKFGEHAAEVMKKLGAGDHDLRELRARMQDGRWMAPKG